ncbi:CBS domain-containing protein CBSX1 [Pyrus ussuriensis x Pyrus communis]|uniref:CBS domain-containing protein CBSX1 n=1 Tax=Pyrus ussuriensis x Pyrus communis TaxID=2448454 RepID=A0A5N5GRA1_9ROSA|nr:CBS domain-containing protein CBSX1 [Pyrus ussuriensis x Pyrus communis]
MKIVGPFLLLMVVVAPLPCLLLLIVDLFVFLLVELFPLININIYHTLPSSTTTLDLCSTFECLGYKENRVHLFNVIPIFTYEHMASDVLGFVLIMQIIQIFHLIGSGRTDNSMFPEVDSTWKTFNEVQNLLSKTNGRVVGDVMTPATVVVRETTNLGDVARLLLETKYRRLPVVNESGKLIGISTRGNIIRAALQMKHASESKT